MSFISMMEARMPPGFRFHPRDDELVLDYLLHKLSGSRAAGIYGGVAIVDVDLNKCEPWDLPEAACVGGKEWYFFNLRDRKYATGQRTNRATRSGYWKATGKDRAIRRGGGGAAVGMRKTLVFYQGRAPKGRKTEWVMHEFRMDDHHPQLPAAGHHHLSEDWVLCRVFYNGRTTTPRPSPIDAGTLSNEQDLPAALPLAPLTDAYIAFNGTLLTAVGSYEQVSCFSGLPALPFKGSPGFGGMLASENMAVRTVLSSMSSDGTTKPELPPNWSPENGLSQMWNPPFES